MTRAASTAPDARACLIMVDGSAVRPSRSRFHLDTIHMRVS